MCLLLYQYSSLEPFFRFKESQYTERRERIARHCRKMYPVYPVSEEDSMRQLCAMYIAPKRGLSYCPIAKVRKMNVMQDVYDKRQCQ